MTDRENPKCPMGHEMELLQVASGGWRYGCAKCATSYKVQKKAHYGWLSPIRSTKELAYEAAVKRPMQKPLTVEELFEIAHKDEECDRTVWMEDATGWADGEILHVCSVIYDSDEETFIHYMLGDHNEFYTDSAYYGKTWRCWAEKPTDEERKAAEWET